MQDLESAARRKLSILEIGSGNGKLSGTLARSGHKVVGVESSLSGVEISRAAYPDAEYTHQSVYELSLPGRERAFDLVLSVEVIEHLFLPKELLRAAARYLRPGGTLILTTPYHGYLKNLLLSVCGRWDRHWAVEWDGGHIKYFSVRSLSRLLESEGYRNTRFYFAGRMPWLWKSMISVSDVPGAGTRS